MSDDEMCEVICEIAACSFLKLPGVTLGAIVLQEGRDSF